MNNEKVKPIAKVIGTDSNVFATLGICSQALKREGLKEEASEMSRRVMQASSYNEALQIMMEYVEME